MTYNFTSQVNAGIKLLDSEQPGWREGIDLEKLNLASCAVCVLGQVFGDYEDGVAELGIEDDPYKYGFNTLNGGMAELTQAWKDALGKNNVLVERHDVYSDKSECCFIKVLNTELVHTGTEMITVYIVQHGQVNPSGSFLGTSPVKDNLTVLRKEDFEEGTGRYTKKVVNFQFKEGQFVTNDTGKVWYVLSQYEVREVKDKGLAVLTLSIDRKGLREVTLPSGKKFSDTVK